MFVVIVYLADHVSFCRCDLNCRGYDSILLILTQLNRLIATTGAVIPVEIID